LNYLSFHATMSAMADGTRAKIDQSLTLFMDRVKKEHKMHLVPPILYDRIREFTLREGKRIRPALMIYSYKGYSRRTKPLSPSIYYVSTCIELLHNFMLIHDDIIDCSDLRRGKPTMHRLLAKAAKSKNPDKLGADLAIVAGDIVYALAIDAFLSIKEEPVRKEAALRYFVQTAVFTAMGEFIDTLFGVKRVREVSEKDVMLNYSLKTARYTFDCPLVVGALLAGAPKADIKMLAELGLLVGQAFQIQDDIIGIFDTQKNIGKSILSDLAEAKKTILVAHAYKNLHGKEKQAFLKIFNKPKKTYADLVAVRKIFQHCGSLAYSLDAVRQRVARGQTIILKLKMRPQYRAFIAQTLFKLFKHSEVISEKYRLQTIDHRR